MNSNRKKDTRRKRRVSFKKEYFNEKMLQFWDDYKLTINCMLEKLLTTSSSRVKAVYETLELLLSPTTLSL